MSIDIFLAISKVTGQLPTFLIHTPCQCCPDLGFSSWLGNLKTLLCNLTLISQGYATHQIQCQYEVLPDIFQTMKKA